MRGHPLARRHGFTLIELLVALVIVAILAAMQLTPKAALMRDAQRDQTKADALRISSRIESQWRIGRQYQTTLGSWVTSDAGIGVDATPGLQFRITGGITGAYVESRVIADPSIACGVGLGTSAVPLNCTQ